MRRPMVARKRLLAEYGETGIASPSVCLPIGRQEGKMFKKIKETVEAFKPEADMTEKDKIKEIAERLRIEKDPYLHNEDLPYYSLIDDIEYLLRQVDRDKHRIKELKKILDSRERIIDIYNDYIQTWKK